MTFHILIESNLSYIIVGTDKSRILEATVFITNMDDFTGMDSAWRAWLGEDGVIGASRATVCVSELAGKDLIEIKCTVAAAEV